MFTRIARCGPLKRRGLQCIISHNYGVFARKKEKDASFCEAPFIFDGGKPNSVPELLRGDDHLSHPWGRTPDACAP